MFKINVIVKNQHKLVISVFIAILFLFQHPLSLANNQALDEQQVALLVQKADQYRLDQGASKVVSEVTLLAGGQEKKKRHYTVYMRENRESLIIFNSQVEAGQKMLMLGDNYWLLMPKSRRPIRITPMQKLLGEASVGDISTLTWSEDYQGKWVKQEQLSVFDDQGEEDIFDTQLLKLEAKTKGASYFTINLWLEKESGFPIKAELFLQSGKLAKKAYFIRGVRGGEEKVVSMRLDDEIQRNQQTIIDYQSITAVEVEDKYYNPSYLSRTPNLTL